MKRLATLGPVAALAPLLGVTACAGYSMQSGLAHVDDLLGRIERLHVEAELAKEQVYGAIDTLRTIVAPDFSGDVVSAYGEFVKALEQSEQHATAFRAAVVDMKESADLVFDQWAEDLEQFSNSGMRQLSEKRLNDTHERYQAIVAAADPAVASFETYNTTLRDIALFLGHDFNADAVSQIESTVREQSQLAVDLNDQLEECLRAAKAYIDASGMPSRVDNDDTGAEPAPRQGRSNIRAPRNPGTRNPR